MQPGTVRLVGRHHELAQLRDFLTDAATDGGTLLVAGEAGVGKTSLLDAAAATAREDGTTVIRGAGIEFEADVGFAGLHQVLQPLLAGIDALPVPQARALGVALGLTDGEPPDRLALANAVTTLLRTAAATTPLLVVVDDMQWLDPASSTLLGVVGRRLAGSHVGLLGGVRTSEDSLVHSSGFDELTVDRLDGDAAAELLDVAFPDLGERERSRVLSEAEGNPLALVELPRGPSASGMQQPTPVGRRLRGHFARLTSALPDDTRDQLLLAALASDIPGHGRGDGPGHDHDLFTSLDAAEEAGLVRVTASGVTFRHPLARAAVVDASVHAQRRRAHLVLAARWPDGAEQRAWHLAEAASGPDEDVAALLEEAALRSRDRGDPVGAVSLLLRSAALSPSPDEQGRRTRSAAFLGIDVTGDLAPIPATRAGTLEAVVPRAAYLIQSGGDIDSVHRLLVDALALAPDPSDADDPALTEALFVLGSAAFFGSRPVLGGPFHDAVGRLSPQPPEELALLAATFVEPVTRARPVLGRLDAAVARIGEETDPARVARLGMAATYVDRTPGCREALWRLVEHGRAGGAVTSALEAMTFLSCDAYLTGDWDQALATAAEAQSLADRHGYRTLGGIAAYAEAMVAAARGDRERTRELTEAMVEWAAPSRAGYVVQLATHAAALADLGAGDHDTAYARALDVCTRDTLPAHAPQALWTVLDLVEAAVRGGRAGEASAHVAHLEASEAAALSPRLAFVVAAARALVSPDEEARRAFDEALALPDVGRWPFHQARLQLAYGERLRRAKSIADARHQLRLAAATFERLGARPWIERASLELRASGDKVAPVSASASVGGLTPQQLEIAQLAAEGLTNKQIGERLYLSPRTVGTHLYQLFPKLGVTSRAALRDALTAASSEDQQTVI